MTTTTVKRLFWTGARDSLPFIFVAGPFGLLFGVVSGETGLDLVQTLTFSATVFAGTSQFTALQLLQHATPILIVLASALAVNLRCAMYSAALTPYLGRAPLWQRAIAAFYIVDQSYALSIAKFESDAEMTVPERMAYFAGTNAVIAPLWCFASVAGILASNAIPDSWSLDFAFPIAFLALVGTMLRTPAHMIATGVSIVIALLAAGLPHNLGLIVGGLSGMVAGAVAETAFERRRGTSE